MWLLIAFAVFCVALCYAVARVGNIDVLELSGDRGKHT